MLFIVRKFKRHFSSRVTGCGSLDGRIFVWMRSSQRSDRSTKRFFSSTTQLKEWCTTSFGNAVSEVHDFGCEE